MNPLVKKIADYLRVTVPACFLEVILEVIVQNWNRCIEVFNFDLMPFDIEYLFGVANCFDAFAIYDAKDVADGVMTDNLIVLEDVTQTSTIFEKSVSEDGFKSGKDSSDVYVGKSNNDCTHYVPLVSAKHECRTQHLRSVITENVYLPDDISHNLHNGSVCNVDKELLPIIEDSADTESLFIEKDINLDKDTLYYGEITEEKINENSEIYETTENDQEGHRTKYLSIAMSVFDDNIYLDSNAAHKFHDDDDSDSDKDNQHLEDDECVVKSENGSQDNLRTNSIPIGKLYNSLGTSKYDFQEDSDRDKDNPDLEEEKFFHVLDEFGKSENGSQDNLRTNSVPISTFNDNIDLGTSKHHFLQDSDRVKDNLDLEEDKFFHVLDEFGKSENGSQHNLSTNSITISILNDNIDLKANNTTYNFQEEDSDRGEDNLDLEDEDFFCLLDESWKSENISQNSTCTNLIPTSEHDNIYLDVNKAMDDFHVDDSEHDKNNLHFVDEDFFCFRDNAWKKEFSSQDDLCTNLVESEYMTSKDGKIEESNAKIFTSSPVHKNKQANELPSTEADVPACNISNKPESQPTSYVKEMSTRNVSSEDNEKIFPAVALPDESSEHKNETKCPTNPDSRRLEFNPRNNSTEIEVDKRRVYFKDETVNYNPFSAIVERSQSDERSKIEDASKNTLNDQKYAKLEHYCSQEDIMQDFPTADIKNAVPVGKGKSKCWKKFNLSRQFFRTNKSDESFSDNTGNSWKRLSLKNIRMHHKSIKNKLLSNVFKK